jgi:tetratricopeptide (TPR) repeat protein
LASAYQDAGKLDLALPLFEETLKLMKAKLGPDHPDTLTCMNQLAEAYDDAGELDFALPLFEETLKLRKAKNGPQHPDTLATMHDLAMTCLDAGKVDMAQSLFEEMLKLRKAKLGPGHPDTLRSMNDLAGAYQGAGKLDLAMSLFRECLIIREKVQPDEWTTFDTKSLLGGALSGQKKYSEAEPLLLAGYEGLKQREAKIPPPYQVRLTEALERLVQLYEVQENKDEVAKWRKELDARKKASELPKRDNSVKPSP